jgi:hypothetical protein
MINLLLKLIPQTISLSVSSKQTAPYGGKIEIRAVLVLDRDQYLNGASLLACLNPVLPSGEILANTPDIQTDIDLYHEDVPA